jgi:quercetin dioxygenase-like cupin family protein
MIIVEYPPGGSGSAHRHHADGFVYMLEGSMDMQVQGGTPVTIGPGQTFYEGPTIFIASVEMRAQHDRPSSWCSS